MKHLEFNDVKSINVVGDIHGEFKTLFNAIKACVSKKHFLKDEVNKLEQIIKENKEKRKDEWRKMHGEQQLKFIRAEGLKFSCHNPYQVNLDNSILIVCGDCGLGFNSFKYYQDLFTKYNKLLEANNCYLLFVRGNHDDPKYFEDEMINFSHIKSIQDYTVISACDYNLLCVGGGLSLDRSYRIEHEKFINRYKREGNWKKEYWEGEMPIFDSNKLNDIIKSNIKIDCVISHTSPKLNNNIRKQGETSWVKQDPSLKKDIQEERKIMDKIYNELTNNNQDIAVWAFGHYHCSFEDRQGDVLFICNQDNFSFRNLNKIIEKEIAYKESLKSVTMNLEHVFGTKLKNISDSDITFTKNRRKEAPKL